MKNRTFPLAHLSVLPGIGTGTSAFAFGLILLCSSCSNRQAGAEALLQQAAAVHEEIIQIEKQFVSQLQALKSQPTMQDSVRTLEQAFEEWQASVIEVPGMEEEQEDHAHEHGESEVQLTPEQMLEVQKELEQVILSLQKRLQHVRDATQHQRD